MSVRLSVAGRSFIVGYLISLDVFIKKAVGFFGMNMFARRNIPVSSEYMRLRTFCVELFAKLCYTD